MTQRRCRCRKKWLILATSNFNLMFSVGLAFNMSVLYVELLDEFNQPKAETALVQSVCVGMVYCSGVISGVLINKFGEQRCMLIGSLLAATGLAVSFVAPSIAFLVASVGVTAGFGFSLIYNASYSVVPSYFKDGQKMLALGSTTLGSGVGALVVPVLLEKLIKEYTWRGALLIFAGIVLNCCISAIISGPNKKRNFKRTRIEKTEKQTEASDSYSHATRCSSSTKEKTASKRSLRKIFLSIITTKSFLLYNLSIMMGFSPGIAVMVFFVDYIEAKGIDRSVGVWLYICLNAAAIFGRIVATAVAQMKRIPKLAIPLVFSLVGSLGMLLFPFVDTVPECAVAGWLLGTSLGGMVCVLSVTTIDLIAADDYPLAFGIVTTLLGIANGFAGPLSGLHRDLTGTYDNTFYTGAASKFFASLILLGTILYKRKSVSTVSVQIDIQPEEK